MSDRQDRSFKRRKVRDWALILPLLGLLFLAPPVASMVPIDGTIAELPAIVVYIFSVWALLIIGAFLLAQWVRRHGEELDAPVFDQEEEPGP